MSYSDLLQVYNNVCSELAQVEEQLSPLHAKKRAAKAKEKAAVRSYLSMKL